jgi:hypothetical protein
MSRKRRDEWGTEELVCLGAGVLAGFALLVWLLEPPVHEVIIPADEPLNVTLKGVVQ